MIKCAGVFTDHMVLLRDRRVCIWGTSERETAITVRIDGNTAVTYARNGKWSVYLAPHKAGGPYLLQVCQDSEKIEFSDVMYGEVFLAAGQSNMEMELAACKGGQEELLLADFPEIRFYNTLKTGYIDCEIEKQIEKIQWKKCVGADCACMSAVAYYAAKTIYERLQVPVGIIDCYQGGTSISSWLPEEILSNYTIGKKFIEDYEALIGDKTEEEYQDEVRNYWERWHAWDGRVKLIKADKPDASWEEIEAFAGECPWPQPAGRKSVFRPGGCYHSMVCTIAPYTLSGILFYQGETDAPYAKDYYVLMDAVITHFRELFRNSELYFLITQLPMYLEKGAADDFSWAAMRDCQLKIYENIKNTDLLVLADCGEYGNIHPLDKKTPGKRMGCLVLENLFHEQAAGRAMIPERIYRDGDNIVLSCINTYGKIIVEKSPENGAASATAGFEIAGKDAIFKRCNFKTENDKIVIEDAGDAEYVRYAWQNYGRVHIRNGAGIPLVPFGARHIM